MLPLHAMLTTVAAAALLLSGSSPAADASIVDYEDEDNVLVLTADNFDKAVSEFHFLLVEFYAPWCSHCKKLEPEYSKAAELLEDANSQIRLGKVDATAEKALAQRFDVRGYPTIKLFRGGSLDNPVDCRVQHTADDLLAWLYKKTVSPFERVDDVDAVRKLVDALEVVVVGFFKRICCAAALLYFSLYDVKLLCKLRLAWIQNMETAGARAFRQVADAVDDIMFAVTDKQQVFDEFKAADNSIVLFKKFDEGRVELRGAESLSVDAIEQLVELNQLPSVVEFNEQTAPKIFARSLRRHLIMFVSKDSPQFDDKLQQFTEVARRFKGKLLSLYVDVDPDAHKRVIDYFGVTFDDCPTYRLFELDDSRKYRPDLDDSTAEQLTQFAEQVLTQQRQPFVMSEELAEDWDAKPVKELVGNNFREVVYDKTKDVIVEFYAPWCSHCKQLAPVWEQLGDNYKDSDHVIVAKLDATTNEAQGVKITYFPTVILFPKDSEEMIEFPTKLNKTLENLVYFTDSRGQLLDEMKGEEKKKDEL